MAHLIKLPSVAADTSGGTLHQWLKKEGDAVAVGDALAEIETEKAIVEINAEQAGVLGRIVIQAGAASVPVNTVIGVLLAQGEDASAIDRALAEAGAAAQPAAAPTPEPAPAAVTAPAPTAPATPPQISNPPSAAPVPGGRLFASPLARRLAAQWHVDLLGVTGTGPHGRIVRRDVEAARDRAPASAPAPLAGRAASRRVPHTGMRR
ncbi:E3 binding domain-containing protein, partial [Achromobacter insolitus]|uniref:E3 binding domain-containing protein n=1 Tax=Achromobacter insolitus TaxID=217204 RepID=UPI00244EEBE2